MKKRSYLDYERGYDELLEAHPELRELYAYCGLCNYSEAERVKRFYIDKCSVCPLSRLNNVDCINAEYEDWEYNPTKENAEIMHKTILKAKKWSRDNGLL